MALLKLKDLLQLFTPMGWRRIGAFVTSADVPAHRTNPGVTVPTQNNFIEISAFRLNFFH